MNALRSVSSLLLFAALLPLPVRALESNCTSGREFVVAHQYLTEHKEFGMNPPQALELAKKVAVGCTGAALRFTRVADVLLGSGALARDVIPLAQTFAGKTEGETATFLQVFRFALAQDGMDLDLMASLKLAKSLTTEFNGDQLLVRDDFFQIVDYCTHHPVIDLSRTDCGYLAARIAKNSQKFSGGIARSFVALLKFLREDSHGPGLTMADALKQAESLSMNGPQAAESFVTAYRYGISKSGLGLGSREAILLATQIAASGRHQN